MEYYVPENKTVQSNITYNPTDGGYGKHIIMGVQFIG